MIILNIYCILLAGSRKDYVFVDMRQQECCVYINSLQGNIFLLGIICYKAIEN